MPNLRDPGGATHFDLKASTHFSAGFALNLKLRQKNRGYKTWSKRRDEAMWLGRTLKTAGSEPWDFSPGPGGGGLAYAKGVRERIDKTIQAAQG